MFQCADEDLADSLLKSEANISSQPLDAVLKKMKALAVIPTAIVVLRSDLLDMKQKRDEPFRGFASRVRGKAETCEFYAEIQCNCGTTNELNYTDHIMRDVLVAEGYDPNIRREVLGVEGITSKSINDVVSLLESKEMARDANTVKSSTFAISSKRDNITLRTPKISSPPPGFKEPSSAQKAQRSSCTQCGESFSPFVEGQKGWNLKPHQFCKECFRLRRRTHPRSANLSSVSSIQSLQCNEPQVISHISAISFAPESSIQVPQRQACTSKTPMCAKLDHHIFTSGEWKQARFLDHPTMPLRLSVRKADYKAFSHKLPSIYPATITAKLDTCAQSCLWSLKECLEFGFRQEDLIPVDFANNSQISIAGALVVHLDGTSNDGKKMSCSTIVYISPSADGFFLSLEAMLDLGMIMPASDLYPSELRRCDSVNFPNQSVATAGTEGSATACPLCSCLPHNNVPSRPRELPFPATPENNQCMKDWLLKKFSRPHLMCVLTNSFLPL